jgi:hypothetical protein
MCAAAVAAALVVVFALPAAGRLVERTDTVPVPVEQGTDPGLGSARATCPAGKEVALGGFRSPTPRITTATHLKIDGARAWRAGMVNSDELVPSTVTAIAYCSGPKDVVVRKKSVMIPPQGSSDPPETVTARCRRGERVAFGGFNYAVVADTTDAWLSELRLDGKRGWRAGVYNFKGTAKLTAIAYCSELAPRTTTESTSTILQGDEVDSLTPRCGRHKRVAFGGYKGAVTSGDAFVLLRGLERVSARTFRVSAENQNSSDAGSLKAFAYCAPAR